MGQNRRWRRCMVDHVVPTGAGRMLDVATGTAGVAIELARRTRARVVGFDLTLPMLLEERAGSLTAGFGDRIELVQGRAEALPFADASFDGLTFTYLLRYVDDPAATLAELARGPTPGRPHSQPGVPRPAAAPTWRAAWWCYTRFVLPLAGWLTGGRAWWRVGRFLGRTSASTTAGTRSTGPWARGVGRLRRRRSAADEPWRRAGDVGAAGRWLRRRKSAPAGCPSPCVLCRGRAGGGTGGRCSIRRTRPGTSPMSSWGRAGAPGPHRPARRHPAGLLPRRGPRRPRARRGERPSVEDRDPQRGG